MTTCRWARCERLGVETFYVCAPGLLWNGRVLAPGETIDLCLHHGATLRDYTYEHELPSGCGPLPHALRLPLDVLVDVPPGPDRWRVLAAAVTEHVVHRRVR